MSGLQLKVLKTARVANWTARNQMQAFFQEMEGLVESVARDEQHNTTPEEQKDTGAYLFTENCPNTLFLFNEKEKTRNIVESAWFGRDRD